MAALLDDLLRNFASVPFGNRVLDLNCGHADRTIPLAQLGFDVFACDPGEATVARARERVAGALGPEEAERRVSRATPDALGYPDAFFDWVVAFDLAGHAHSEAEIRETLSEARRVLKNGGWIYFTAAAIPDAGLSSEAGYAGDSGLVLRFTPDALDALFTDAGFAPAQKLTLHAVDGYPVHQGIYRRVDADTPV